jgi:hypothetical protein
LTWDKTDDYIRSGHGDKSKYDSDSFRTIAIYEKEGIKAIIGHRKGHFKYGKCETGTEVESFLFSLENGWTVEKAKTGLKSTKKEKRIKCRTIYLFSLVPQNISLQVAKKHSA